MPNLWLSFHTHLKSELWASDKHEPIQGFMKKRFLFFSWAEMNPKITPACYFSNEYATHRKSSLKTIFCESQKSPLNFITVRFVIVIK